MDFKSTLEDLHRGNDTTAQLEAINQLSAYAEEQHVFDALCAVALKTVNTKVRNKIISLMKPHAEKACRRFAQAAANPTSSNEHRWALVNLSLLDCRSVEAHAEVRRGLSHPDFEVQKAAFLSTGLFDDPTFLLEVERFMERNRFFLVKDGAQETASKISEFIKSRRPNKRSDKVFGHRWLGRRVKS